MCLWAKAWPLIKEFLIVFGPLLAAIIVIVGKEWFDRRRYHTSWFIENLVVKGLDPIITYFDLLKSEISLMFASESTDIPKPTYPAEALSALHGFLDNDCLPFCFSKLTLGYHIYINTVFQSYLKKDLNKKIILKWTCNHVPIRENLLALRDYMIKEKVNSHQKIFMLHKKEPYKSWIESFDKLAQDLNVENNFKADNS